MSITLLWPFLAARWIAVQPNYIKLTHIFIHHDDTFHIDKDNLTSSTTPRSFWGRLHESRRALFTGWLNITKVKKTLKWSNITFEVSNRWNKRLLLKRQSFFVLRKTQIYFLKMAKARPGFAQQAPAILLFEIKPTLFNRHHDTAM